MPEVILNIQVTGQDAVDRDLRCILSGLGDRSQLHAAIATEATEMTREYLQGLNRHRTANRLGAAPTNFRERNAISLQPACDEASASMLIPRNTGLGRAFHDVVTVPGSGKTYLTIPACARTYGKVVRDFPEGTFKFAILHAHRPFPVLLFVDTGEVGYWLRRSVFQKQDRTLLPTTDAWGAVARRTSVAYVNNVIQQAAS